MAEEFVRVGDVDLCYEVLGDAGDPTVLLIMGLGLQLTWWRDDFCGDLVGRGFRVVRFDNRDVGRSTHLTGGRIGPLGMITRRASPAYSIADMADDAAGLIAHVAPNGAHVVGVSLGSTVAHCSPTCAGGCQRFG
jgi:pimeloyl-ACP methyl ester carboxylesterase